MDSGEVLCFLRCGDIAVVGAPPAAWAGRLVGAVSFYRHTGKREGWADELGHNTGTQGT